MAPGGQPPPPGFHTLASPATATVPPSPPRSNKSQSRELEEEGEKDKGKGKEVVQTEKKRRTPAKATAAQGNTALQQGAAGGSSSSGGRAPVASFSGGVRRGGVAGAWAPSASGLTQKKSIDCIVIDSESDDDDVIVCDVPKKAPTAPTRAPTRPPPPPSSTRRSSSSPKRFNGSPPASSPQAVVPLKRSHSAQEEHDDDERSSNKVLKRSTSPSYPTPTTGNSPLPPQPSPVPLPPPPRPSHFGPLKLALRPPAPKPPTTFTTTDLLLSVSSLAIVPAAQEEEPSTPRRDRSPSQELIDPDRPPPPQVEPLPSSPSKPTPRGLQALSRKRNTSLASIPSSLPRSRSPSPDSSDSEPPDRWASHVLELADQHHLDTRYLVTDDSGYRHWRVSHGPWTAQVHDLSQEKVVVAAPVPVKFRMGDMAWSGRGMGDEHGVPSIDAYEEGWEELAEEEEAKRASTTIGFTAGPAPQPQS